MNLFAIFNSGGIAAQVKDAIEAFNDLRPTLVALQAAAKTTPAISADVARLQNDCRKVGEAITSLGRILRI